MLVKFFGLFALMVLTGCMSIEPITASTTTVPRPTVPRATPTAPVSQADYDAWLESVKAQLTYPTIGTLVLEASYPNGNHRIVWVRTSGFNRGTAATACEAARRSYTEQFKSPAIVHIYDSAGISAELASCGP